MTPGALGLHSVALDHDVTTVNPTNPNIGTAGALSRPVCLKTHTPKIDRHLCKHKAALFLSLAQQLGKLNSRKSRCRVGI